MRNKQESLVTELVFNSSVVVEVSADCEGAVIYISNVGDEDNQVRSVCLEADEIEVLIGVLSFYKNRLNKKRAISGN